MVLFLQLPLSSCVVRKACTFYYIRIYFVCDTAIPMLTARHMCLLESFMHYIRMYICDMLSYIHLVIPQSIMRLYI